jgi:nitrate reductase gamma subunit
MRRFHIFSALYLATAVAFAILGFSRNYFDAYAAAGFALTCAICSMFGWWRRIIVNAGRRNNLIFDLVGIAVAIAIQAYGLLTARFGIVYFLIGFIVVTLISMAEDAAVLQAADRARIENS